MSMVCKYTIFAAKVLIDEAWATSNETARISHVNLSTQITTSRMAIFKTIVAECRSSRICIFFEILINTLQSSCTTKRANGGVKFQISLFLLQAIKGVVNLYREEEEYLPGI